MGCDYIGPIDGHNIQEIIETLQLAKNLNRPVIVHAKTIKGKGYPIAEGHHEKWHGVSPFDISTGVSLSKSSTKSATAIFSETLYQLAKDDKRIVGVTAAMPSGTGIDKLIENFPDRFWDVAIAEQHAITSMAAMAKEGFKPFVAIYSTFLQRGYDQIIHDVCLMNLGVTFCIDRAGIVGADGETHQGQFDINFLRFLPNMTLIAPRDEQTFKNALRFAVDFQTPLAIRCPRGSFEALPYEPANFQEQQGQILKDNSDKTNIALIGYGVAVAKAIQTEKLSKYDCTIVDLMFLKPLPTNMLLQLASKTKKWYIFSDSQKQGGVATAILEFVSQYRLDIEVVSFEYDDIYIQHGDKKLLEEELGILPSQLALQINPKIDKE